jgi:hypothetical protein
VRCAYSRWDLKLVGRRRIAAPAPAIWPASAPALEPAPETTLPTQPPLTIAAPQSKGRADRRFIGRRT